MYVEREQERGRYQIGERTPIESIAKDLKDAGKIYKALEKIEIPEIETFLKRMKVMKLGVVTPLLLWLYTSKVSEEQRLRSVKALESYLVRRMLCDIPSSGLNKVFMNLLKCLVDPDALKAIADTSDAIVAFLLATQWPNDRELYEHLITNPMRGATPRKKMVFEAVEMHLRGGDAEPLGDTAKLTVEHIMPQKWQQNWPLLPNTDETEATENRDEAVKSIGNFTLITAKLNAKLSNNPWSEKRRTLNNHSSLFLNKQLLNGAPDVWDEAAIQERSKYLAKIIMEIWPSADKFTEPSE